VSKINSYEKSFTPTQAHEEMIMTIAAFLMRTPGREIFFSNEEIDKVNAMKFQLYARQEVHGTRLILQDQDK
jgi:hypothetical protein